MRPAFIIFATCILGAVSHANTLVTIVFPTSSGLTGAALLSSLATQDSTGNTTFSAQQPDSASISGSTGEGGVLSAATDSNGADILLEFTVPVASVSVNFPGLLNGTCPPGDPVMNCYNAHIVAYNDATVGLTPAQV